MSDRTTALEVRLTAADQSTGMTLGELRAALDCLDQLGAGPDSPLVVMPSISGRIKSLTVSAR